MLSGACVLGAVSADRLLCSSAGVSLTRPRPIVMQMTPGIEMQITVSARIYIL